MKTKEFSFNLPPHLIAQYPAEKRGESRLLVLDRSTGKLIDSHIEHITDFIQSGSVMVVNNSKVRKARVYGTAESGATVEFLFLGELPDGSWTAMVTKSKKQRVGKRYTFSNNQGKQWEAEIVGEDEEGKRVQFSQPIDEYFFSTCGHVPLPPYIKRDDTIADESRYQTVFAHTSGSVAAPTAGLHFTEPLLDRIQQMGVTICPVTLHVGPGTFLPVRTEELDDHPMHREHYEVPQETAATVNLAKKEGRAVIAVGTTSVRTLESACNRETQELIAGRGSTQLFIKPPYTFTIVDQLITNFHTPESTLLVLVSAFASKEFIFSAYEHAVQQQYRFFSYGDAMFIK